MDELSVTKQRQRRRRGDTDNSVLNQSSFPFDGSLDMTQRRRVRKGDTDNPFKISSSVIIDESFDMTKRLRLRQGDDDNPIRAFLQSRPSESQRLRRRQEDKQSSTTVEPPEIGTKTGDSKNQGNYESYPQLGETIDYSQRRRRRGDISQDEPTSQTDKSTIPHPILTQEAQIKTFANSIAHKTAEQFLQECLPPFLLSQLSEEQLALQQLELSAEIAHSMISQLAWALNRAWLDAKNSPSSLV